MNLQQFVVNFLSFANSTIIPFLMGIALLLFIINVIRFFVAGAGNEESREKARSLAVYGVLACVFILIFWGIVNLFAGSLKLSGGSAPISDYVQGA